MGPLVLDKLAKFHDPSMNCSPEIPSKLSEVAFSTVFPYKFRPEVDNDVISGTAVDNVGMDVPIKYRDSRSNGFRDIRVADFAPNE